MSQETNKRKHSNDTHRSIPPMQELHAIDIVTAGYFDLSSTAKVLMVRIIRWTNGNRDNRLFGHSWAGRERLAKVINRKSKTTVSDALRELKDVDLIIVKRRPNDTSLIRPNWDRINEAIRDSQRQEAVPEDQKTVHPEDQFSVHSEGQKTGSYSTDHYSAERDSTDHHSGTSDAYRDAGDVLEKERACGVRRLDQQEDGRRPEHKPQLQTKRPAYKQSKTEAERAWGRMKALPWRTEWDNPEYRLHSRSGTAAIVYWNRLIGREGIAAGRIVRCAEKFLASCPDNQRPSLAGFLHKYASCCADPESDLYVPEDERQPAANDNRDDPSPVREVS